MNATSAPRHLTDHPGRPATVWDLLALAENISGSESWTVTWHIGPRAGQPITYHQIATSSEAGTRSVHLVEYSPAAQHLRTEFARWHEEASECAANGGGHRLVRGRLRRPPYAADREEVNRVLAAPPVSRVTVEFDYTATPEQAADHQVHLDGLGVTRYRNGAPEVTYRFSGSPGNATPEQMYASHRSTIEALARDLGEHGFAAQVENLDDVYGVRILNPVDPTRVYLLRAAWMRPHSWAPEGEAEVGWWYVWEGTLNQRGRAHYPTLFRKKPEHALGLPLDTPVPLLSEAAARLFAQIDPGTLTTAANEDSLRRFAETMRRDGQVTSTWLPGPAAWLTTERIVIPVGWPGAPGTLLRLSDPTGSGETLLLDLADPMGVGRFRLHADGRGLTARDEQGAATAFYRLVSGARPEDEPR